MEETRSSKMSVCNKFTRRHIPEEGILYICMSISKFWITIKNEYPNLHEIGMICLLCFSTTHLCETAFSAMAVLKTKQRNRLQLSDSLRLAITPILHRINKITNRKQKQKPQ
jgi:hypothetical protein